MKNFAIMWIMTFTVISLIHLLIIEAKLDKMALNAQAIHAADIWSKTPTPKL